MLAFRRRKCSAALTCHENKLALKNRQTEDHQRPQIFTSSCEQSPSSLGISVKLFLYANKTRSLHSCPISAGRLGSWKQKQDKGWTSSLPIRTSDPFILLLQVLQWGLTTWVKAAACRLEPQSRTKQRVRGTVLSRAGPCWRHQWKRSISVPVSVGSDCRGRWMFLT